MCIPHIAASQTIRAWDEKKHITISVFSPSGNFWLLLLCSFLSQLFSSSLAILCFILSTSFSHPFHPHFSSIPSRIPYTQATFSSHFPFISSLLPACLHREGDSIAKTFSSLRGKLLSMLQFFSLGPQVVKPLCSSYWFIWQEINEYLLCTSCCVTNGCNVSSQTIPQQFSASSGSGIICVYISQRKKTTETKWLGVTLPT